MNGNPEIRVDILIQREEDYYSAHCLQFDIVATGDTIDDVQEAIIENCIAHIQFSYENNNMEHLCSPAPPEVWNSYFALFGDPLCTSRKIERKIIVKDKNLERMIPPFMAQELLCNAQSTCRA